VSGKQKLYNTFEEIIQTTNYADITIKDFIKEAKVNRNTFYYHFDDMDGFLKEYLDDMIFFDVQAKIVANKLSEGYNLMVDYIQAHRKAFLNILHNEKGTDVVDYILHTGFRMDITKVLYDYEHFLKIHVTDEFVVYYAHNIADEFMRALKMIVYENTNISMMKKVFALFADSISTMLVRVSKLNLT
jgi:AcrR family transcriptional regulator